MDIVVCPPFTALGEVSKAILDSNIRLGAQNMSEHNGGAYTGEIAAGMLKEFSVRYVILGHSERRAYQKEPDALIAKKAAAVHAASLKPIVCVGETLAEREAGQTQKVLETQVRGSLAGSEQGPDGARPSLPMSRSGPSAPARPPPPPRRKKPMRSSAGCWTKCSTKQLPGVSASNMVGASNRPTRAS